MDLDDAIEEMEQKAKKRGGNRITRALIRKRAEHNESVISTLEELTMHQEELVAIDEVLGMSCRKLKILYLQNNIISKMEHLHHLKDLEYLNLALNNIAVIEGLDGCEFLNKLDMTVNFVDVDALAASVTHLRPRAHLKELYMMGNPAQHTWPGFQNYVIARLPQLQYIDGTQISRSMRIIAEQQLPHLELELEPLAVARRAAKALEVPIEYADDEKTPYTPEVRTKMYEELAEQKQEAEDRKSHMQPRQRDDAKEQREAVERARMREEKGVVQQCNQGKWDFFFDEETKPGSVVLDVSVARHLDSSLIDLDVHPHYVSVVIKSKTLRLSLPCEVMADAAKAQRSKTTGHLVVTMPKVDKNAPTMFTMKTKDKPPPPPPSKIAPNAHRAAPSARDAVPSKSIAGLVLSDATPPSLTAVSTTRRKADEDDDDEPPPLL